MLIHSDLPKEPKIVKINIPKSNFLTLENKKTKENLSIFLKKRNMEIKGIQTVAQMPAKALFSRVINFILGGHNKFTFTLQGEGLTRQKAKTALKDFNKLQTIGINFLR
ncbi:MAG: hypothetical protein VKJ06_08050 [Vampirovibrionales bacterium]|nr:hypothetical protein [Vampirovibrionales bacterium]